MQDKNVIKLTDGAALLEQGASILEGLGNDERNRGNCSTAEGAGCSAHTVRRLASALPAHDREIGQCLHQIQEPAPAQAVHPTFMVHTGDSKVTLHFSSEAETLEFYRTQPEAASAAVAMPAQALTGEARAEAINRLVPIRAKLAAAAAVAVPDERAAFEAWAKSEDMSIGSDCDGYIHSNTAAASLAWQARAALAATPAAVQTHAEAAAALGINSALTRIRAGNHAKAIEPLEHALRALAATPAAAAPVVLPEPAGLIVENLLALARIVDIAVEDWGESFKDGSMDVKFHSDVVTELESILDHFEGLPEGPDDNVIESGPIKAARILRALLAGVSAPAAMADTPNSFREWFAKNYPADTIILDPDWHAKSIFRMAQAHARLSAPQAQADARDAEQEVLMEHSGCGSNTQVDMLTVRLNPGDKVVMHKGRITQGFDRANRAAIAAAKGE